MKIEVYLDAETTPFKILTPPERLILDTKTLRDGKHVLNFKTLANDGELLSERELPFRVQNE